ncbi:hypothetical protein L208DRAFT_1408748 [Tricholoma matsutake]|nr:hypothetical protein L208DRAFT_1408748 [Tricholoma matsutake 945]
MSIMRFKLVFFSPQANTRGILAHLFEKFPKELGKIGQYEHCAFISRGVGQFKPAPEARPTIGMPGVLEFTEEDRVEIVVNDEGQREDIKKVIQELEVVHPYEEVAYDVYKLEDL